MRDIIFQVTRKPKAYIVKRAEDLSEEDIKAIRLAAIRAGLHRAVDMGLYDSAVKGVDASIKSEKAEPKRG